MYPVSGGTARFPHFAFGSIAGISFGFFSWLQAVTVAPIECFAVMQYGSYYWHGLFNSDTGNVTGRRLRDDDRPDGDLHRDQLPRHAAVRQGQQRHHLVEGRDPGPHHHHPAVQVPPRQLQSRRRLHPVRRHLQAIFAAIPGAGIVFAYLGFEQADQLAGEIKNPQRNLPRAIILAILIGTVIYSCCRSCSSARCTPRCSRTASPPSPARRQGPARPMSRSSSAGPFAGLAGMAGLGLLATILRIDAFVSPFGTGLIYQTSTSRVGYGLARNRYYPQIFAKVDANGVPVGQPDLRVPVRPGVPAAVPELALAGRPGHRRRAC